MGQHLLQVFLNTKKDSKDPLYMALDCWDQVIYKALQSYNLDYKYIFAKDINPVFIEHGDNWNLLIPDNDLNQSIYEVELVDFRNFGPCLTIENLINQNEFVVMHTAFELVPAYNKKEIAVLGRIHYSIIVGYDDLNYYIIDNQFALDKSKNIVHPDFPNISIIEKTVFFEAFNKKCELRTIRINPNALASVNRLDSLLPQMVSTFNSIKTQHDGDSVQYYGRQGFTKLIDALGNSGLECLTNNFLSHHYNAHLLYSSRLILKWCLENDLRYHDSGYFPDVFDNLVLSLEKWEIVKMLIAKNNGRPSPNFLIKLQEKMLVILEIETKFCESVSKLISS